MSSTPDSIENKSKAESLAGRASHQDGSTLHAENASTVSPAHEQLSEKPARRTARFPDTSDQTGSQKLEKKKTMDDPDVYIMDEEDCYDELGFSFPTWKKWTILTGELYLHRA